MVTDAKGDSKLFEHTLRYREFITPTIGVPENGWAGPGVRAGANVGVFRGEIRFKQDMKITNLKLLRNYWQTVGITTVFMVTGTSTGINETDVTQLNDWKDFILNKGDWFALYSPQISNTHIFVNRGVPLIFRYTRPGGEWISAWSALEGKDVKKYDVYTYELLSITFPVDVQIKSKDDLINTINYIKNPTDMSIIKGKKIESDGLLEFTQTDNLVEIVFPKPEAKTNLTLPLRVQGFNHRWSVGLYQKEGYVKGDYGTGKDRYRPLGLDVYGNAYVPIYVDYAEKTHVVVGHPVTADQDGKELFIQVTHVNENPQHWHVSVNNPTDKPITTTLQKTMEFPGFDFLTQKVTVPAGGYIMLALPK